MNDEPRQLIITGSFNGLLERVAKIDFFDVWLEGCKIIKKAKKLKIKPTMRMSEVSLLTGLTMEDIEFFVSLRLIECAEAGDDPQLSLKDVFCLVRGFERMIGERLIDRT